MNTMATSFERAFNRNNQNPLAMSLSSQGVVYSNKERFDTSKPRYVRKPLVRLFEGDRQVYLDLVDITELPKDGTITRNKVREMLNNILNQQMHITTRCMIENLLAGEITRQAIDELLVRYEDRLVSMAPDPLPEESKVQYMERTNLPTTVVDLVFKPVTNITE